MPIPDYDVDGNKISGFPYTGVITVSGSGVLIAGPNVASPTGFTLRAHPANTQNMWIVHPGLTKTQGFPLPTGGAVTISIVNLNQLTFDADVGGERICYIFGPP